MRHFFEQIRSKLKFPITNHGLFIENCYIRQNFLPSPPRLRLPATPIMRAHIGIPRLVRAGWG